jgi:hypothetical protein
MNERPILGLVRVWSNERFWVESDTAPEIEMGPIRRRDIAARRLSAHLARMAKLFFSYSHKDEDLRNELETHLATLKREGLIEALHDRRIPAGAQLDNAIDAYLEEADVILCLVSPDFINSEYCYSREMTRALERDASGEAKVIPVIVRHCDWPNTPLAKLRGTPRDNRPVKSWLDRDEAWLDVARDVRTALLAAGGGAGAVRGDAAPVAMPASHAAPVVARPRSANVAVERRFTDLDRDRFVRQTFEFVTEFFANSLAEAQARAPDVEGSIVNLDANRFTAAAYRDGRKAAAITVFMGGMSRTGREISFQLSDDGATNTSNGSFYVTDDEGELAFKNLFGSFGRSQERLVAPEDVAEQIWSAFFDPMSRSR